LLEILEDRIVLRLLLAVSTSEVVDLGHQPFPLLLRFEECFFDRAESVQRFLQFVVACPRSDVACLRVESLIEEVDLFLLSIENSFVLFRDARQFRVHRVVLRCESCERCLSGLLTCSHGVEFGKGFLMGNLDFVSFRDDSLESVLVFLDELGEGRSVLSLLLDEKLSVFGFRLLERGLMIG